MTPAKYEVFELKGDEPPAYESHDFDLESRLTKFDVSALSFVVTETCKIGRTDFLIIAFLYFQCLKADCLTKFSSLQADKETLKTSSSTANKKFMILTG